MVKGSINQLQKGVRLIEACASFTTYTVLEYVMAYLHCWTRIQVPTGFGFQTQWLYCTMQNMFTLHRYRFESLSWLKSPIAVVPILGWISGTKIGIIVRVRQFTEIKECCMRLKKDK